MTRRNLKPYQYDPIARAGKRFKSVYDNLAMWILLGFLLWGVIAALSWADGFGHDSTDNYMKHVETCKNELAMQYERQTSLISGDNVGGHLMVEVGE